MTKKAKLHIRDDTRSNASEDHTLCGRSWPPGLTPWAESDIDSTCSPCKAAWRLSARRAYVVTFGTRMFGILAFAPAEAVVLVAQRLKLRSAPQPDTAKVRLATTSDAEALHGEIEQLHMIETEAGARKPTRMWADVARAQGES